jgi:hypothetical protein
MPKGQDLGRCVPGQPLARPAVELGSDRMQMVTAERGEIDTFGKYCRAIRSCSRSWPSARASADHTVGRGHLRPGPPVAIILMRWGCWPGMGACDLALLA